MEAPQSPLRQRIDQGVQWYKALVGLIPQYAPVDSMLREVPTHIRMEHSKGALAVPENNDVVFSESHLLDLAKNTLTAGKPFEAAAMRVAAANYRALAAAELASSATELPLREVGSWTPAIRNAFMALEVGRLETQFSRLYPSLGDLFLYDVSAQLEESLGAHKSDRRTAGMVQPAFAYVALRPYLPVAYYNRLYDLALDAGADDTVLDEIGMIGERFATLVWPKDATTGRRLAERLAELVSMPEAMAPSVMQRGEAKVAENRRERAAQLAQETIDQQGEDDDQQEGQQGQQGDQEGQQEGAEGDGEGEGQGDPQQGQGDAQGGPVDGSGQGGGSDLDQLRQELRQQQDHARQGKEGQRVEQAARQAMAAAGIGSDPATFSWDQKGLSLVAYSARQQMKRAFAQLVDQTAGGVAYATRRGRIVPLDRKMGHRRYRSQVIPNRRREVSAALAIVADASGSMEGNVVQLGEAIWAIKGGLDDVNLSARNLTTSKTWLFNEMATVLYGEGQRLPTDHMVVPKASGGTHPGSALTSAKKWLADQQVSHRFLVILTDGSWDRSGASERTIEEIAKLPGGHTMLFGLDSAVARHGLHSCQTGFDLKDVTEMSNHARAIVAKTIKAGL